MLTGQIKVSGDLEKMGKKCISQLANHCLQPLGHLSIFDSEAGLHRALKQFLSAARTISSLRFVRQRKKLLFHYASARRSNNLSFQNVGVD
jgi:hypothetical protein